MNNNNAIYDPESREVPQYIDRFERPKITRAQMAIINFLKEESRALLAMTLEVIWNGPNADDLKGYLYTGKPDVIHIEEDIYSCIEDISNKTFSQLPPIMDEAFAIIDQTAIIRFLILEAVYAVLADNRESTIVDVSMDCLIISYTLRDDKGDTEKTLSLFSIIEVRSEVTLNDTIKF